MAEAWWGVTPEIAGTLEAWGWSTEDDATRQALPTIARHGNAVLALPPSPAWASPALAGVMTAVQGVRGRALLLAAPAMVEALGRRADRLAAGTALRIVTATGPARAARHLAAGSVDLVITSPATALALHSRSALQIDALTSVVLAWPERWDADEALTLLLGEIDKDAQRLLLTGAPAAVADLAQRHVRRSLAVGFPAAGETPTDPPRSIRLLPSSWRDRPTAVADLLEAVDPTSLAIWTADRSDHEALRPLAAELPGIEVVARGAFEAGTVVCHDLPRPGELALLGAGRDVVLMVPPGTEGYARHLAAGATAIRLGGAVDRLRDRDAALRAEVLATIEAGDLDAAGYAISPLLDRHDPQAVAAACYTLWRRAVAQAPGTPVTAAAAEQAPRTPGGGVATAKLWVGIGRRDDATPGDLVAVLVREVGLTREMIGRIELRETFTLVEVPVGEADRAAQGLTGLTIRGRRLTARVDRGSPGRGDRGGPARGGGSGGTGRPGRGAGRPRG